MTLNEYLQKENKTIAWFARLIGVVHCVARRWVRREAIPSAKYMNKIVDITGGEVQPNDFYLTVEESK